MKVGDGPFEPVNDFGDNWGEPADMPPGNLTKTTGMSRAGFSQDYFNSLMRQDKKIELLVDIEYWDVSHKERYILDVRRNPPAAA